MLVKLGAANFPLKSAAAKGIFLLALGQWAQTITVRCDYHGCDEIANLHSAF